MATTAAPAPTTTSTAPSYGGLYGGLALVTAALTGGQLFADIEEDGLTVRYPNLWEMLSSRGAPLAMLALTMVGLLVLLCAIAAVRRETPIGIPITIVLLGVLGAVMLIARVGTRYEPELDTAGSMLLVTCWAAVLLGVVHTIHLIVARRRERPRATR